VLTWKLPVVVMSRTDRECGNEGGAFHHELIGLFWRSDSLAQRLAVAQENTEPHCDCGAEAYAWRRARRVVGTVLLVVAGIACMIGVLALMVSAGPAYFQQD